MSPTLMQFGMTTHAEIEVRNAEGELVDRSASETEETVEVDLDDMRRAVERRGLSDSDLERLGFTDEQIRQIRSDT